VEVQALIKKFRLDKLFAGEGSYFFENEFSGGELQKLELIDAALKDADVLIVDEGTSSIDLNSESVVIDELVDTYRDKIIIFVAHRLAAIKNFDNIIVVDEGKIAESGAHKELIDREGKYSFLWGVTGQH
jgi:ABC-type multidrug transport system fused ATPase/permease subunit